MQSYSTIIGVIELRQGGVRHRTTSKRYGIWNSTITFIMNRFTKLGLSFDELKAMSPKSVEEAFYLPENLRHTQKPLPDFHKIHARMAAMEHPNLEFLWMEYKESNPDGYQLSQFYELYRRFLCENTGRKR